MPGGESVAIIGPSGSGKTSLLMVIAGLERATSGRVEVAGRDFTRLDEDALALVRGASIGIVFQSFHLVPTMTALENVALPLEFAGKPDPFETARALLGEVGLAHREDHFPAQLSGGEQQRVALARAWALRPRVLFLDEPTASLDPGASAEVERLIRVIADDGCSIVMVTHHLGQARRLADDIVFVDAGRITEHTLVADFFAAPRSEQAGHYLRGELSWT